MMAALIKFRVTLVLAVSLVLLGTVAGVATFQLGRIVSRQVRADTAAEICTLLEHQQYTALAELVDPTPVPPSASGTFDAQKFQSQLQALDQQQGTVNDCSWSSLQLSDESGTYQIVVRRRSPTISSVVTVVLEHEPNNGWLISRSSAFVSYPV
ncbi:MAG TPA: hypothetical protein VJR48_04010 [Ktedonobacterales bacterium]|nr:hypothetical protein [Ktedonobacterales bacterium]